MKRLIFAPMDPFQYRVLRRRFARAELNHLQGNENAEQEFPKQPEFSTLEVDVDKEVKRSLVKMG